MAHSIKEHLTSGRIKRNSQDKLFYSISKDGIPQSFCKKAQLYTMNFKDFHAAATQHRDQCCKGCLKKYDELLQELKVLRLKK
jgi:hypothetical protein